MGIDKKEFKTDVSMDIIKNHPTDNYKLNISMELTPMYILHLEMCIGKYVHEAKTKNQGYYELFARHLVELRDALRKGIVENVVGKSYIKRFDTTYELTLDEKIEYAKHNPDYIAPQKLTQEEMDKINKA